MARPVPPPGRPPVVRGTVGGPMSGKDLGKRLARRRWRKIKAKLTFEKKRRELEKKISKARDRATFGPTRRKVKRLYTPSTQHIDASRPQITPMCHLHVGKSASGMKRPTGKTGLEKRGKVFCPSCQAELDTERGKLPKHEPAPPPYTHCAGCNAYLPNVYKGVKGMKAAGGCYNDLMCPQCYDKIDSGPGTVWGDGTDPAPPHIQAARAGDTVYDDASGWHTGGTW